MAKKVVVIYGPPGSGKGTQANLLAWTKNFIHFDTGKFLEQVVNDPDNKNDSVIQEEKKLFDGGKLLTPSFVLKVTREKTVDVSKAGFSIVFSGSPRTMFEAFGDNANRGLVDTLNELYGKENVYFVLLEIDPKVAIQRNKNRRVCSVCATAILYNDEHQHKTCPLCGGELRTRAVDNPAVLETRIKEYEERTKPIVAELEKRGYKINKVNAATTPFDVFAELKKKLQL